MRTVAEIGPEEKAAYDRYMNNNALHVEWYKLWEELLDAHTFERQTPTQQLCTVAQIISKENTK